MDYSLENKHMKQINYNSSTKIETSGSKKYLSKSDGYLSKWRVDRWLTKPMQYNTKKAEVHYLYLEWSRSNQPFKTFSLFNIDSNS